MKLLKLGNGGLGWDQRRTPTPRAIAPCRGMQVAELLARAEVADAEPLPKGLNLPRSWRGVRGACKPSARRRLTPLMPGPRAQDQINLTDPDSRILPTAGGFEQSYKAAVDTDTMLVVATGLSQAANGKQQITPMVERRLARGTGRGKRALGRLQRGQHGRTGRESHHLPWQGSQGQGGPGLARRGCSASANRCRSVSRPMRWNVCGIGSRPGPGARRSKQTVEPVFGIHSGDASPGHCRRANEINEWGRR
jgi:hypothetical protein